MRHRLLAVLTGLLPALVSAEPIRLATFNTELERDGPGLMLRDIERGNDPQIRAVLEVIAATKADILLLQGVDWDAEGRALTALTAQIETHGLSYPYRYAPQPNRGLTTGLDMNGDGRTGGPEDSQGYGEFTGQGGMALLSRLPIEVAQATNFSTLIWQDLPGATLPTVQGEPFPSDAAQKLQRLSTTGHWVVPIRTSEGSFCILAFQASPPVFDGPEDRNGLRNRDELRLWSLYLNGELDKMPCKRPVIMGGSNLDPWDSDGYSAEMRRLLDHPMLQDPTPESSGARDAPDQGHRNDNATDTVDWPKVGRLRVDYILPSSDLDVIDTGVIWPSPKDDPLYKAALEASRHRLVWVDLQFPSH
ncbi:endonuclease/exonuclease/phosphatase family protein [Primorskyibacter sp. S87]|uniref:endonuclease/exonuclease/phosphatase family protein n=1 Tax=Primorskyibacter sp. S87 TaxID=3415126 RepID=UPI003C7D0450